MQIIHHGAVEGVTGSCHEVRLECGDGILIDCGLFQGADVSEQGASLDRLKIDFPISHIKALVVTHCHIDHVGRILYLLAAGFEGLIYCSEPSALLLPLMLEDALKVGFTRNRRLVSKTVGLLKQRIKPVPYKQWQVINDKLSIKFHPAGHILGSAYVECRGQENNRREKVTFSGDLGAPYAPLLPAPKSPYGCDVLVLESTYGDRTHQSRRERKQQLKTVLEKAVRDNGLIIVPAFSLGRTQELLYELEGILSKDKKLSDLEVIVDSPLAAKFTEAYRELKPFWDREALKRVSSGRHPLTFDQFYTVGSHQQHLQTINYLKEYPKPVLVIAASGMCSGGRVVNYLKQFLSVATTDLLFIGYQAEGTPGRDVQKYAAKGGYVLLEGERIDIKAQVHSLSGYSAHADQKDLINFVKRMRKPPSEIRLVHGSQQAKERLKNKFNGCLPGVNVVIP